MRDCPRCGKPVDGLVCQHCPQPLPRTTPEGKILAARAVELARSIGQDTALRRRWPERVLERVARGERLPAVALDAAYEVMDTRRRVMREPGEDDE